MKYEHTSDVNLKRHPDTGVYYFKRGSIELSLKTKDFKEAKLRKAIKEAELDASGTIAHKFSVAQLVPKYTRERIASGELREGTIREMRYVFDSHLLPFFGKHKLGKVTPGLWKKYCLSKPGLDLANHRKVMTGFLKWCADHDYLEGVPDVSRIPKHQRRHRRIAKPDELRALFKHARGSLRVFLTLALYNGMRRKEIMTLRWADINFAKNYLVVQSERNKLGRGREIPINDVVASVLAQRLDEVGTAWVFPNARDTRKHADLGGLMTAWRTCLRKAGVCDLTWHDLRATYEKYAHKSLEHTDTQREKFSDATSDVQKRIYVSMDHEDLRGLETVVQVPGLDEIVLTRGERGDKNA